VKILYGALLLVGSTVLAAQSNTAREVGEVAFANSGARAAQPEFLRGLAQLHNFEYDDAAAHFREAQKIDPGFAMAYWGEAMTKNHGIWHEQDLAAAHEVLSKLAVSPAARLAKAPTEREREYLGSIEVLYGEGSKEERDQKYVAEMARLYQHYPGDVDAAAFYALAILGSAELGRDFAIYMRAAAVLEEVFPLHPRHPGVVHYLIHSYDDPIHAPLGLRPARIYAQIAPDAGHAQHMTSHIFLALGMWDDVVKANETAIAVVNHHRELSGKPPVLCGHYNEWLQYAYLQLGRVSDARQILEGCRQQAERQAAAFAARVNARGEADSSSIHSYAEMRAHFLISSELWQDEVAHWTLPAGDFPLARLAFDYTDTLSAYKSSQFGRAREALARVDADAKLAIASLDQNKEEDTGRRGDIAVMVDQLRALLSSPNGEARASIAALLGVAAKETALPLEFGPPPIYKPTEEILGELYLQIREPKEARKAFEADLARAPGRRLGVRGLKRAGNEEIIEPG
jgi:tetratricopeptide (TPR) repeat protein